MIERRLSRSSRIQVGPWGGFWIPQQLPGLRRVGGPGTWRGVLDPAADTRPQEGGG